TKEKAPFLELTGNVDPLPDTYVLRTVAIERLTRDVADHRRSLMEAAALVGALRSCPPELQKLSDSFRSAGPPLTFVPKTEDECICTSVVWQVYWSYPDRAEAQAELARFEAQLQEEIRLHGEIRLADPKSLRAEAQRLIDEARSAQPE